MKEIISPLTKKPDTVLTRSCPSSFIIDGYKNAYNIDTSPYFFGVNEVELYKCIETGYEFFYPYCSAGDSAFYEQLQKFDWYYMPWKWEHKKALQNINKTDKILEVGCGDGGFLKKLHKNGFDITGLELNEDSVCKCTSEGLRVLNETVEIHAENNSELYDVVCSFQVLEHIAEVASFLEGSIKSLKPGGKLIISVPDNSSFIKEDDFLLLNMPPHHMGLWSKESLKSLTQLFPITIKRITHEPLQKYHVQWYINLMQQKMNRRRSLRFFNKKLKGKKIISTIVKFTAPLIHGHTIMAIYSKK